MNIYTEFKPTYLYVKQHSITGKLYFGKSSKIDLEKYKGSGKLWLRHIKKHGKEHVINLWYCLFYDKESIKEFAEQFSEQQNIVISDEWLNLKSENGIDGGSEVGIGRGIPKTGNRAKGYISEKKGLPGTGNNIKGNKRKPLSESCKSAISKSHLGIPKTGLKAKGMPATGMKAKGYPRPILTCPHCNKTGGQGGMSKHHFNNCKYK